MVNGILDDLKVTKYVHAQDTSSTADVKDNLVLEDVAVLIDRVAVRAGADIIFL
jgi:hypothetical protein